MSRYSAGRAKRTTTFRRTMTMLATIDAASRKNNGTSVDEDVAILPGYNVTATTNGASSKSSHFETDLHGNVNIFLGGAMLTGVIVVVFVMCYCCHKSIRKNRPQEYPQYWRTEPDIQSLQVFTTEAHATCCEGQSSTEGNRDETIYGILSCPVTPNSGPGPPPTYDSLMFDPKILPAPRIDKKSEDADVPDSAIPSTVSTLFALTGHAESTEANEEGEAVDGELPSYEAALKLNGNGYV